jgi:hypothetical protein
MDQARSLGNGKAIARILLKPTKSFFFNLLKDAGTRAIIRNYELLMIQSARLSILFLTVGIECFSILAVFFFLSFGARVGV